MKVVGRFLALREFRDSPTVYDEDVEPAVIIVVEQGDSPTCGGKQKVLARVAYKHGFGEQSGIPGYINIAREISRGSSQ
jgi:hypothetical protein